MIYVTAHNPLAPSIPATIYGPFASHEKAQRFAESLEELGFVAGTRRVIAVEA